MMSLLHNHGSMYLPSGTSYIKLHPLAHLYPIEPHTTGIKLNLLPKLSRSFDEETNFNILEVQAITEGRTNFTWYYSSIKAKVDETPEDVHKITFVVVEDSNLIASELKPYITIFVSDASNENLSTFQTTASGNITSLQHLSISESLASSFKRELPCSLHFVGFLTAEVQDESGKMIRNPEFDYFKMALNVVDKRMSKQFVNLVRRSKKGYINFSRISGLFPDYHEETSYCRSISKISQLIMEKDSTQGVRRDTVDELLKLGEKVIQKRENDQRRMNSSRKFDHKSSERHTHTIEIWKNNMRKLQNLKNLKLDNANKYLFDELAVNFNETSFF